MSIILRLVSWSQYGTEAGRNIQEELANIVKQDKVVVFMKVRGYFTE